MSKRKASKNADSDVDMDSGSESIDEKIVDVDFELFDPNPTVDIQGIRNLLRQLFDNDAVLQDLSSLTELILSQPTVGTTVKVDGIESDPYAFLTVLNLRVHKDNDAVKQLVKYYIARAGGDQTEMGSFLKRAISGEERSEGDVGIVLAERLINMPVEIVPPMYKMLLEEVQWALEDKEPYNFSHFVIPSKTYTEVASTVSEDEEEDENKPKPAKKKWKYGAAGKAGKAKPAPSSQLFYFHPEDELWEKEGAGKTHNFKFIKLNESGSDSKRTFDEFGIMPRGSVTVISKDGFEKAVDAMAKAYKA
ncbi:hypothetical protein BJ508DRAFT_413354 [Ascobolus immersus RN42]|uniref:Protein BCP1 n=1 Tax=Ascobolus immersus RN42 TaxID=1160509 RepID=A0A3N4IDQ5_ASCIM|nr:hypothetical protein BJ508DRAFT_413354 [Ascobolus immersus RN42]